MTTSPATARAASAFQAVFRRPSTLVARAPGRVNLIGEHLDYNAGHVLPFAIHLDCAVAIGPSAVASACLLAFDAPGATPDSKPRFDAIELPIDTIQRAPADELRALAKPHHWSAYVLGVLFHLRPLLASPIPAFNVTITTDVPLGGGLSSSASLEVALARALLAFTNSPWDPHAVALACQRAEHEFARVPCGLMDQLTSASATTGHALRIDCSFRTPPEHIPLPLSSPSANNAPSRSSPAPSGGGVMRDFEHDGGGASLLIIDSGVRHALATSEFANRVATCTSAAAKLRLAHLADLPPDQLTSVAHLLSESEQHAACHVSTEQKRVRLAVEALRASDFPRLGQLMLESHASLRDDYRVSCPELDLIVETAVQAHGVHGARMTGGGFGGCAIALAHPDAISELQLRLRLAFQSAFKREPRSFTTTAHAGASLLASMP